MCVFSPDGLVPVAPTNADNDPGIFGNWNLFRPGTVHTANGFRERENHVFCTAIFSRQVFSEKFVVSTIQLRTLCIPRSQEGTYEAGKSAITKGLGFLLTLATSHGTLHPGKEDLLIGHMGYLVLRPPG